MRSKRFTSLALALAVLVCCAFPALGSAQDGTQATADEIAQIFATIQERKDKIIEDNTRTVFPATGYAAAEVGLLAGKDLDAVNKALIEFASAPITDYSFFGTQGLARVWYDFNANSSHYPGRLTAEAESVLKQTMFDFLQGDGGEYMSTVERASWNFKNTIIYHGSENHDIGLFSYYYLYTQILKEDPAYRDKQLPDGHTVLEHYNAWQEWIDRYYVDRVKYGMLAEVNSPIYFKYTIAHLFDVRDYSESAVTRQSAEKMIDTLFAIMTNESINGIIGGARTRSYQNFYSNTQCEFDIYSWAYFKTNDAYYSTADLGVNGIALYPMLSDYVPPYELVELAVNYKDRGNYMYKAIPLGRQGTVSGKTISATNSVITFPSEALRTTYITPEYMLGAMAVDGTLTYSGINAQNRWNGVTFVGGPDNATRVFFQNQGTGHDNTASFDDATAMVSNSTMLVQRLSHARDAGNMRTFFPAKLYDTAEQRDGWMFAYDPDTECYIGIKPSRGEIAGWEAVDGTAYKSPGAMFLTYTTQNIPIVTQVGSKSEYGSFEAFMDKTVANPFEWINDKEFTYTGPDSGELKWSSSKGGIFFVDGEQLDLDPEKVYDSKFISSVFGSGIVDITNTKGETFHIDVNTYEPDYKTREYEGGTYVPPVQTQQPGGEPAQQPDSIRITVLGQEVAGQPSFIDGRTFIPLRSVFEAMGYTVTWDESVPCVVMQKEDDRCTFCLPSGTFTRTGEANRQIDGRLVDSTTLLPAGVLQDVFGLTVRLDSAAGLLTIIGKTQAPNVHMMDSIPADVQGTDLEPILRVLHGVGLLGSFTKPDGGQFGAGNTMTRAELATAAAVAMGWGGYLTGEYPAPFGDVPASHWASGAIMITTQAGLMTGIDGMFRPDQPATLGDAIRAAIHMLGYGETVAVRGGDMTAYYAAASQHDLLKSFSGAADEQLTRAVLAQLWYNLLDADFNKVTGLSSGSIQYSSSRGDTFASQVLGIDKVRGILTENQYTSILAYEPGVKEGYVRIGADIYHTGTTNAASLVGYGVSAYVKADKNDSQDRTIVYIEIDDRRSDVLTLAADDIESADVSTSQVTIAYAADNGDGRTEEAGFPASLNLIYNNKLYTGPLTDELFLPDTGSVTLIDATGDGTYDAVFIRDYQNYVVDGVGQATGTIRTKYLDETTIRLDGKSGFAYMIQKDGAAAELGDLMAWDIISVAASYKGDFMEIIASSESVTGEVSELSEDEATIDDTQYKISAQYPYGESGTSQKHAPDITAGAYGTFYLDFEGKIMALDTQVGGSGLSYGFLIDMSFTSSTLDPSATFKLFSVNNKDIETLTAAAKITIDGTGGQTAMDAVRALSTTDGSAVKRQVIKYKTNSRQELTYLDTASPNTPLSDDELHVTSRASRSWMRYENSFGTDIGLSPNTLVLYVSDSTEAVDEDFKLGTQTFQNIDYMVEGVDCSPVGVAKMVVLYPNDTDAFDDSSLVVDRITEAVDPDGEITIKVYGMQGGKQMSYPATASVAAELTARGIRQGDIISTAADSKGRLKSFKVRYQEQSAAGEVVDSLAEVFTVVDKDGGYLLGSDGAMYYVGSRSVYRVDRTLQKVELASFDDIPKDVKVVMVERVMKVGTPSMYVYYED